MTKFSGKGVCGGIAIGKICLSRREKVPVKRMRVEDTSAELARFDAALSEADAALAAVYEKALVEVGESGAQIFEIHRMMLADADYLDSVRGMITAQSVNAEYAVALTAENFAAMFMAMSDGYMQARAADVQDISDRLIGCLTGSAAYGVPEGILCADDLAPSETVLLDKSRVTAFVTAGGSASSHTVILARSMGIPAVIGMGAAFLASARDGETAIVNGATGEVILAPDAHALREAERMRDAEIAARRLLESLRGKDNVTQDGRRIEIYANIGGVSDIGQVLLSDAGGIGLFRSEFLYLERSDYPSEEEQFAAYRRVLESMAGRRVIIRTLDIGADKQAGYFGMEPEENPALGLRAIRLCLTRPEIFKTQLRALWRASAFGRLGIMFPMIADLPELEEALALSGEVRRELMAAGIPVGEAEMGIMIETPAAAIIADRLAPMVDFFSVGTNDLTQYTLACDRQNPALERFCDTHHEAVLRLIGHAAKEAHACGKWIGICGELAADTSLTARFLDMGIDELSVAPASVLPLRKAVRGIGKSDA